MTKRLNGPPPAALKEQLLGSIALFGVSILCPLEALFVSLLHLLLYFGIFLSFELHQLTQVLVLQSNGSLLFFSFGRTNHSGQSADLASEFGHFLSGLFQFGRLRLCFCRCLPSHFPQL
ncbi:hypothetical protein CsSME_00035635 [Camellia sinensis var. sinensis]